MTQNAPPHLPFSAILGVKALCVYFDGQIRVQHKKSKDLLALTHTNLLSAPWSASFGVNFAGEDMVLVLLLAHCLPFQPHSNTQAVSKLAATGVSKSVANAIKPVAEAANS